MTDVTSDSDDASTSDSDDASMWNDLPELEELDDVPELQELDDSEPSASNDLSGSLRRPSAILGYAYMEPNDSTIHHVSGDVCVFCVV